MRQGCANCASHALIARRLLATVREPCSPSTATSSVSLLASIPISKGLFMVLHLDITADVGVYTPCVSLLHRRSAQTVAGFLIDALGVDGDVSAGLCCLSQPDGTHDVPHPGHRQA